MTIYRVVILSDRIVYRYKEQCMMYPIANIDTYEEG